MTRLPSPRRPRRRQRWMLPIALLRALLALVVLALFGGVCLAALADSAQAIQMLTIVAPLVTVVFSFYFGQRRE